MTSRVQTDTNDDWSAWSDEQLSDFESRLYDEEVDGEQTWALRERVIAEMNSRGMLS